MPTVSINLRFSTVAAGLLSACLALLAAPAAWAEPPFLIVEGAIRGGQPIGDGRLRRSFSEAEVLAMPTQTVTTLTDWRPRTDYVGPTLHTVLQSAGAIINERTRIQLIAFNDYSVTIPSSDLHKYDPVLAHTASGKRLTKRDFGPLWLMYPREQHEELRNNATSNGKLIWQVLRITVH
jgi:hypothetical protein